MTPEAWAMLHSALAAVALALWKGGWFVLGAISALAYARLSAAPRQLATVQTKLEDARAARKQLERERKGLLLDVSDLERRLELTEHERDNEQRATDRLTTELEEANKAIRTHVCPKPNITIEAPPVRERF